MNTRFTSSRNTTGVSGIFQKQNYEGQTSCASQSRPRCATDNTSGVTKSYFQNFTSGRSERDYQFGWPTATAPHTSPQYFNSDNDGKRRVLYIVRGASGSGKSTLSRQLCSNGKNQ